MLPHDEAGGAPDKGGRGLRFTPRLLLPAFTAMPGVGAGARNPFLLGAVEKPLSASSWVAALRQAQGRLRRPPTCLILSRRVSAVSKDAPSRPARGVRLPSPFDRLRTGPFDTPPSAATQGEERGVGGLWGRTRLRNEGSTRPGRKRSLPLAGLFQQPHIRPFRFTACGPLPRGWADTQVRPHVKQGFSTAPPRSGLTPHLRVWRTWGIRAILPAPGPPPRSPGGVCGRGRFRGASRGRRGAKMKRSGEDMRAPDEVSGAGSAGEKSFGISVK